MEENQPFVLNDTETCTNSTIQLLVQHTKQVSMIRKCHVRSQLTDRPLRIYVGLHTRQMFQLACQSPRKYVSVGQSDNKMGLDARKPVFGGLRTTQAQTSLRIRAV